MRKHSATLLLLIFFNTTIISGLVLCFWLFRSSPLHCIGDADWNIDNVRFTGTVSFQMHKKEGLAMITGQLNGTEKTDVNRLIYFRYTQQFRTRFLHTVRIVRTFSDTVDDKMLQDVLPGFYLEPGGELIISVDEFKSAYVFSNANVPYLFCRKK